VVTRSRVIEIARDLAVAALFWGTTLILCSSPRGLVLGVPRHLPEVPRRVGAEKTSSSRQPQSSTRVLANERRYVTASSLRGKF